MKKTYINPDLKVVTLNITQHLLDGSLGIGESGSANGAEGRRGYFDEDEE